MIMLVSRTFFAWLPTAIIVTVLTGLAYTTAQQTLRQTANDAPQQLAEDITAKLMSGTPLTGIDTTKTVDLAASLAPFFVIYDANGQAVAGTGLLNGKLPT